MNEVVEFQALPDPPDDLYQEVCALFPRNPFYTQGYAAARRRGGEQPWIVSLRRGGRLVTACTAFLSRGLLDSSLEIQSLPPLPDEERFWSGVRQLCKSNSITVLNVQTFGSPPGRVAAMGVEIWRRKRCEYTLALGEADPARGFSSNHRRNAKNAERAGIEVFAASGALACRTHAGLIEASSARRRDRGEEIGFGGETDAHLRLIESGAGTLWQARRGEEILSSVLILSAARGAYYHSGGSSPDGMKLGASHFLFSRIIAHCRARGAEVLNFGSSEEPGLTRFKAGFGTVPVALEAAGYYLGSPLRRKVAAAIRLLRDDPAMLLRRAVGEFERYAVYSAAPADICRHDLPAGMTIDKLGDDDLRVIVGSDPVMAHQAQVRARLGYNDAYAIRVDGALGHVIWLVPAEHDRHYPVRNVKLRPGEAEITHAVTVPRFRGKGLYPVAIRYLACLARERGIRRLYMVTGLQNTASQRGIEGAGLARAGTVIRFHFALADASITFRGHRLRLPG